MSRVLLTWELGLNLGHLTRLLPVAERLKAEGHTVLVAARDLGAASQVLVPAGIPLLQAPHLTAGIPLKHRASGYADILLSQGWSDAAVLNALAQAWLNLLGLYRPDRLILDYSPTVSLAARIARIPVTLVGNGFELPPATDPLPPFPGFSWATADRAAESECIAIRNANTVLTAFGGRPLTALRDLFLGGTRLLATFPELDHYGPRADECYIGPLLGGMRAPKVDWPDGEGPRLFACLRPDTQNVDVILSALMRLRARVICIVTGFSPEQLQSYKAPHLVQVSGPVDLGNLKDADLCITYGAEGTMLRFLLAGVPQLLSPWHVETFIAGRRIAAAGLGRSLPSQVTTRLVEESVCDLVGDTEVRARMASFVRRHAGFETVLSAALVADYAMDEGTMAFDSTERRRRQDHSGAGHGQPSAPATEPLAESIAVSAARAPERAHAQ